jgi:Uncharacterized conserved protein
MMGMSDEALKIQKLLFDIHKSASKIVDRMEGQTEDYFSGPSGEDLQDMIARRLGIVGEAAAALIRKHPKFCEEHPEIPFQQARALRNVLIHDYDGIDWHTVWMTAKNDLPGLIKAIEPCLDEDTRK